MLVILQLKKAALLFALAFFALALATSGDLSFLYEQF